MSIDKVPTGTGWGCLRFGVAAWVGSCIYIGLAVLLTYRVWPLVLAGTLLSIVVWWGSAKSFGWRWGLWFGIVGAPLAGFVLGLTGYLIHPHSIPGR